MKRLAHTPTTTTTGCSRHSITASVYYHGSPLRISGILFPGPSHVLGGDEAVFASNSREVAVAFTCRWTDDDIEFGVHDDDVLYLKERKPNAFDVFKQSGYLYHVSSITFESDHRLGLQGYEFISHSPVRILKRIHIEDVLSELQNTSIRMDKYNPIH